MAENKLEFKITHDSTNKEVQLTGMSLEVAQAFVVLVKALTDIVDLTPNGKEIRINVTKGSAKVSATGAPVATIEKKFRQIVGKKSAEKELAKQWRSVQELISNNGITYEANFEINNKRVSILNELKGQKKLNIQRRKRNTSEVQVQFLTGKMIAVGGKNPNIHVEIGDGAPLIIACNEQKANKAKAFLYSKIWLSVWETKKGEDSKYEMCDSYFETQKDMYDDFAFFMKRINTTNDKIESLKLIHYKARDILETGNYAIYRKFLRLFNTDHTEINVLKTLLIVSRSFSDNQVLAKMIESLDALYRNKYEKL